MDCTRGRELLAEVRADIAAHLREVDALRRVEAYLSRKFPADEPGAPSPAQGRMPPESVRGLTQAQLAEQVLREANRPLNTQEIVEGMISKGFPERGDRKQLFNSVFSALRRAPQLFGKVEKGIWSLREWITEGRVEEQDDGTDG